MLPTHPSKPTPFATEYEFQAMPRWSPKGDRIAYVAAVDGLPQVFTKSLNSGSPTQITREPQSCMSPFWSDDATRIYFISGTRADANLRSIAVAGGQSEVVLRNVLRADLSSDGKTMAVLVAGAPGQPHRLAFSSPPGAPPRIYAQAPLADPTSSRTGYIQFDPTGNYLGLLANARGNTEFWKIPLNGRPPEPAMSAKSNPARFIWLRDGVRIVTDDYVTVNTPLSIIDLASGGTRAITSGVSREVTPSISPDGETLAFASGEIGYDIIEVPVEGSAPRTVISTARSEISPAWAPDGVRFAYSTDRSGVPEIWLRNRADGSERRIAGPEEFPEVSTFLDSPFHRLAIAWPIEF